MIRNINVPAPRPNNIPEIETNVEHKPTSSEWYPTRSGRLSKKLFPLLTKCISNSCLLNIRFIYGLNSMKGRCCDFVYQLIYQLRAVI